MNEKKLYGKDGNLYLTHKGVKFAEAGRFCATLIEKAALQSGSKIGLYTIGTGYKAGLLINDTTVTDDETVSEIIKDLENGIMPQISFQGKFKRKDGYAEKITFRDCLLAGNLDYTGLIKGFVWDIEMTVNELTDKQLELFREHG